MQREIMVALTMVMLAGGALGCGSGTENRAKRIDEHAQRAAVVRESGIAQRLATPKDSGRIIYDQPTDLSLANARRTGASIVGMEKAPQPAYDSASVGARSPGGAKP